jgi:hypothetical protein
MLAVPIARVETSTVHPIGGSAKIEYIKLNFVQNFVCYIDIVLLASVFMLIHRNLDS